MSTLSIALINNMPDGALEPTDRQFRKALARAASGIDFRFQAFVPPHRDRSERALAYTREYCSNIEDLWAFSSVDALIITGTEPTSSAIENEPLWPLLTQLFLWAEEHATSTLLSCYAAHAAVQFFDGIRRRPLPHKLCGLYELGAASDDPLVQGEPHRWLVPQSRYNDVPEEALRARGYKILSRSDHVGADLFARESRCFFLGVQGHPEYDSAALLREYLRDIRRYLRRERGVYPRMPESYFTPLARSTFERFAVRAQAERRPELATELDALGENVLLPQSWHEASLRLFRNWLRLILKRNIDRRSQLELPHHA